MVQWLVGLGYGLVAFGVLVGVGLTVLANLGTSVGGTANTTIQTIMGYLGTGTGGLVNWLPVIIAMVIGGFALNFFVGGKSGEPNL